MIGVFLELPAGRGISGGLEPASVVVFTVTGGTTSDSGAVGNWLGVASWCIPYRLSKVKVPCQIIKSNFLPFPIGQNFTDKIKVVISDCY